MRRLLLAGGAALLVVAVVSAALPATDHFTRADGALGVNWTAGSVCTLTIVSNTVKIAGVDSFCIAKWATATDAFPADQCSQLTIITLANADSISIGVRSSGVLGTNFSGYLFTADGAKSSTLDKIVNEAGSSIRSLAAQSFTVGDVIKLCVQGTTLTTFKNGAPISTDTDSAIATGQPFITIFDSAQGGNGNVSLDDWVGTANPVIGGSVKRATTLGVGL